MKPGGGKAKGAAFERMVCKRLSLWVSDGKHEDLFWRSAMSGGRATVAHRKGVNVRQAGDITAVSPEGHALTDRWYIETKHIKKLYLDSFLIHRTGPLAKFWKVAVREAKKHNRRPMLIARQNGWPVLVFITHILPSVPALMACNHGKDAVVNIYHFSAMMESKFQ